MTDDEIKQYIDFKVTELHEEKYCSMNSIYTNIKVESKVAAQGAKNINSNMLALKEEMYALRSEFISVMNEIESFKEIFSKLESNEIMINQHAVGVQNVYNEFLNVKKLIEIGHIKRLINLLQNNSHKEMLDELEKVRKFIESSSVKDVISRFYDFQNEISEILRIEFHKDNKDEHYIPGSKP